MSRAAAWLAAIALAGCASWAPRAVEPVLSGRIAVQVEAEPGMPAQAMTAQFELAGNAGHGSLTLSTTPSGPRISATGPGISVASSGLLRRRSTRDWSAKVWGELAARMPTGKPW